MPSDKPDKPNKPRKLAQTIVSVCVLLVLAGIALAIFAKQFRFDRSVRTISAAISFDYTLPDALTPKSPPEHFTPETLWEKINGAADFYVDAGLAELDCQRFTLAAQPTHWLELYVYDMAEWAGAMAVFRPREGSTELTITEHAYESAGSVFFVHDRYYVEIRLSEPSPQLAAAGMQLARNFIAETDIATAERLDPAGLFPPEGLVAGSIKLRKRNVFGFDGLDNVYTATYYLPWTYRIHRELYATAYVSPRASADEAERLGDAYEQFLRELGAGDVRLGGELPAGMTVLELSGYYYVIFHRERFMAGVNECKDIQAARGAADLLDRHLSELAE